MGKKINYEEAYHELKEIAESIADESIPVDALAEKVSRAAELIRICQAKLKGTEDEVNNIIKQMDQG